MESLSEWLPREKLYAMPRSLQTQGSRPWAGWPLRTISSVCWPGSNAKFRKSPIPTTIYQSVTQTGLALRDNTPRIYVIASAGGGASGMLSRPRLRASAGCSSQMRHPDGEVSRLPDVRRPQRPRHAQGANWPTSTPP